MDEEVAACEELDKTVIRSEQGMIFPDKFGVAVVAEQEFVVCGIAECFFVDFEFEAKRRTGMKRIVCINGKFSDLDRITRVDVLEGELGFDIV